jgi:type II secretory pathway pseudopilin PulG
VEFKGNGNEQADEGAPSDVETVMRVMDLPASSGAKERTAAFTLVEVVLSACIIMLVFGAIIGGYIQVSYRAEWAGRSLAAQAAAVQQLESAKCAVWDPQQTPVQDEINKLPRVTSTLLDLPVSGTNISYATNTTTVTLITNTIGTYVYSNYYVQVNTVWQFNWRNRTTFYTNTIADYFAPD